MKKRKSREMHGLLPLSNRHTYYCISCKYELTTNDDMCPHNKYLLNQLTTKKRGER